MTSPFHTSPESPRANVSPTSITSPSHPSFPSVEFITSSSPLSLSYSPNADSSGTNSAPSSPSSIRRSAGSRKSLNLSSLASSLHRSPTQKTVSSFIILSVQVPVLARKKKINFCNTDNVKEALQLIKEKFELGDEMESYELFIPHRSKYCKRTRQLSSYKLKDNDEVVLKERKGSSLMIRGKDKDSEISYVVRVALPIAFTRSHKPSSMFRHLPSASPASSLGTSPASSSASSSTLSVNSFSSSPAHSPIGSPVGSPIARRRSLSNSSSSLSLMNVGKNLSGSKSSFNLARKNQNRNSVGVSNDKDDSGPVGPGMFVDEFVCDVGHTAYDVIKKVEERYPLVDRDILDDFSLYKDGVWLDRRKTFDWYKITPNDVLVFKPLWIRLELELEGKINTIKVLPNFTIRVVKNYIKRFSMTRDRALVSAISSFSSYSFPPPSTSSSFSSSYSPSSPKTSRITSSPTLSSFSPSLSSPPFAVAPLPALSISPPPNPAHQAPPTPPSDLKATWDFTNFSTGVTSPLRREPSRKSILEVAGDLDEREAVEGFSLAETRDYFAKYQDYELFLMPSTQPPDSTVMGILLDDDKEVSFYRLQRHMKLSFRKNDEFTKRHFKQEPQFPEPGRLKRTSSPSFPLSAIAALSGYVDDRIYVVVNSGEHRICKLFDFDKDAIIRHIIESILQSVQATTGIKENPDRYSLYLNTNDLMGGETSSSNLASSNSSNNPNFDFDSNIVLLDATKNLSLYPLKDMDSLELRRNTSVFGIDPAEFDLHEDNGCSVPFFLSTIRNELSRLGGWGKEGIFRVAGSDGTMNSLSRHFFHNTFTSCEDIYSLASFIKRWFLRLPSKLLEPLTLDDIEDICTEDAQAIRQFINSRLGNKTYRELFRWLIALGADVAAHQVSNKMNAKNMAIVFGPVLYETEVLHTHQKIIMIVQTLIEDYTLSGPPPRVNSNNGNNNNNGHNNNNNDEGLKRKPSKSRIFGGN